jgi:class 3 adenylate cyclase
MPDLSASAEAALFALSEEERWDASGLVRFQHLARASGGLDEQSLAEAVHELEAAGLARTDGQRRGMVITGAGREAASALSVTPPEGRVSEFVGDMDGGQLAAIDTIVSQGLRSPGGRIVKLSTIRASVRKAFPSVDIATATKVIDALTKTYLERSGDQDPSYLVTLRGLLASRWGSNALSIVGHAVDLLRTLHTEDPSVRRFSWRSLRTTAKLPQRALNLTYETIMLAKLGHGLTDDAGDRWWTVPPDLDIVLECAGALDYVSGLLPQPGGPESAGSPTTTSPDRDQSMTPTTETLSILFMDLSGWSKLRPPQVASYLEKALPKLAEKVQSRFKARHLNTWGDALVAAFGSAREAAECALDIRDFFERTSETDGVPIGLRPRISLHVGEVLIAWNPFTKGPDIFGDAVHLAARLEPKTAIGKVFCTQQLADALAGTVGLGPVAHLWGEVELPKDYGRITAFIVTGPNEEPPAIPSPGDSATPTPIARANVDSGDSNSLPMDRANARAFRQIIESAWMVDWCGSQNDYPQYVKHEELKRLSEYLREADKPERDFRDSQLNILHTTLVDAMRVYVRVSGKERIPSNSAEGVYVLSTKQLGEDHHLDDYDQRYQGQINAIGSATDALWSAWQAYARASAPFLLSEASSAQ